MAVLVLGIILFLGVHLIRVVAPGFRQSMVERMGVSAWRGLFSVVSIVTLVFLIFAYAHSGFVNVWFPPHGMAHLTFLLMLLAVICLVASLLPPGHIATRAKHPMVLSVKIWALAHLLVNGDLANILLFGAFLAWGVILRISLKRRERSGEVLLRPFVSAKYDIYAVVIGVVAWGLIIWKLHEWIIGVSPLALL
jgi:uncharacterized membrane protein